MGSSISSLSMSGSDSKPIWASLIRTIGGLVVRLQHLVSKLQLDIVSANLHGTSRGVQDKKMPRKCVSNFHFFLAPGFRTAMKSLKAKGNFTDGSRLPAPIIELGSGFLVAVEELVYFHHGYQQSFWDPCLVKHDAAGSIAITISVDDCLCKVSSVALREEVIQMCKDAFGKITIEDGAVLNQHADFEQDLGERTFPTVRVS